MATPMPPVPLPDPDIERRRQAAYGRLGSTDPACVVCGESDWRCLELHHVAGRAFDDLGAILCRNCHRKQSDPSANARGPHDPPVIERAGRLMLGLAAFLAELVARLRSYGTELVAAAAVSPWPYGWVGAPEGAS
jgi:hypothetical protein